MTRISTLEHNVKRFVQQFCDKLLDNFLFYPFISAIFLKYVETDIGVLSTLHSSETPDPILFPSSSSPPLPLPPLSLPPPLLLFLHFSSCSRHCQFLSPSPFTFTLFSVFLFPLSLLSPRFIVQLPPAPQLCLPSF